MIGGNKLLIPAGMGTGTRLVEFSPNGNGLEAKERWTSLAMKPDYNDILVHDGNTDREDEIHAQQEEALEPGGLPVRDQLASDDRGQHDSHDLESGEGEIHRLPQRAASCQASPRAMGTATRGQRLLSGRFRPCWDGRW